MKKSLKTYCLTAAMLTAAGMALCLLMPGGTALAADAEPVIISTDYPGVSAKPGASVTFPLYIVNNGIVNSCYIDIFMTYTIVRATTIVRKTYFSLAPL